MRPEEQQYDGQEYAGLTVGHKARLQADGPWGHIQRIEDRGGRLWLHLCFDEPLIGEAGFPVKLLQVSEDQVDAIKEPAFEVRKLTDDGVVYECNSPRQFRHMLDELDAIGFVPVYGLDLDTGKRHLSFGALAHLASIGCAEADYFALRGMSAPAGRHAAQPGS